MTNLLTNHQVNNYNVSVAKLAPLPEEVLFNKQVISSVDYKSVYKSYSKNLIKENDELRNRLLELRDNCEQRILKTKKEMNERFRKDLEENVSIAFEDGRKKGVEEGKVLKEKEMHDYTLQIKNIVQDIQEQREKVLKESESDVLKLALLLVKKIIIVEPQINKDIIKEVIIAALSKLVDKSMIKIHINPENIERIQAVVPEILTQFKEMPKIELEEDQLVGMGGCMIETLSGFIDARLETQLQKLSDKILESVG